MDMILQDDQKQFEERSDYIITEDLISWNVINDHFTKIQGELKSTGIKLLVGPRGTGKTHQMKVFQENCKRDSSMPLCLYVSFTKYFYLEPYFSKKSNAIQIFHSWVLAKLVLSCIEINGDDSELNERLKDVGVNFGISELIEFIASTERGLIQEENSVVFNELSINSVITLLEKYINSEQRKRCVVLFDDAALTLTPEYLVELFDIIRSIKTKTISPKASVYPGTTEYGPRFHIGQDGEEVLCWLNVEDPTYSSFMDSLVDKRFGEQTKEVNKDILEIFKYASFGIPRAFISLIRNYLNSNGTTQQSKYNSAIEKQEEFIKTEYHSLTKRLPQFKKVIEVGYILFDRSIQLLTHVNKGTAATKQLVIGIEDSSISENRLYPRMIRFLDEAGVLYDLGSVSHGERGSYHRFTVHLLFMLRNRAFSQSSRGFNPTEILEKIRAKSQKHPLRKTMSQLLDGVNLNDLRLNFPVCANCGHARLSDEQLFCHNCGKELIKLSAFEECLKVPIEEIDLTTWQKEKMRENNYTCIEDFVSKKDPASSLREIYGIGQVKATKISTSVDKFVSEYLS
jgi:hypothetical protein